jgi:predicted GIY-YIG superfamily endonuclease
MAQIISNLVQNVGGGIGFVSEAYKASKASKTQKQAETNSHQLENSPCDTTTHDPHEEVWELDEAQDDLIGKPETTEPNESTDPITLAEAFLVRLPPSSPPATHQKLPCPIIIPQRRPTDRSRGIITAYPPILSTRSISQATFLDFLSAFNKSTQATKWIAALNLASIATVVLPTVTSILVSMAITAATTAAMELQGRYKTNRFLDKVNKEFFMPKGLFCVVLTWNPESQDARTAVDFEAMAKKVMEREKNPLAALRRSNGKTYGELRWPETAPLIYPALDNLATASDAEGQAKKSSLQKKRRFVEDYMDRRAQAKFVSD